MSVENNRKIIITGCGFKSNKSLANLENIFHDSSVKINIGTATAKLLYESGYDIILLSKTKEKLELIKNSLLKNINKPSSIFIEQVDLLNTSEVESFVHNLVNTPFSYSLVHSMGLSSNTYSVKDDNPYKSVSETSSEMLLLEFESVTSSLLLMVKNLLPILKGQQESNIIVINSMSGIRSFPYGFSHTAAKGGLHQAVRSLCLELNKENIFVSEIMPGIVDTGYYDSVATQEAVVEIAKTFGYQYQDLPMMEPIEIAKAVKLCLESGAHYTELKVVSKGQFPHSGS